MGELTGIPTIDILFEEWEDYSPTSFPRIQSILQNPSREDIVQKLGVADD